MPSDPAALGVLPVHHLAVVAADIPALEHFYVEVLGLPVVQRWQQPDGRLRSVWLGLGGESILMLEAAEGRHRPTAEAAGWHLVALRIDLAERAVWRRRLVAHGVTIDAESPHSLYFCDPEGNRLALSHWPSGAPD